MAYKYALERHCYICDVCGYNAPVSQAYINIGEQRRPDGWGIVSLTVAKGEPESEGESFAFDVCMSCAEMAHNALKKWMSEASVA